MLKQALTMFVLVEGTESDYKELSLVNQEDNIAYIFGYIVDQVA
jgi:hypothetical protein